MLKRFIIITIEKFFAVCKYKFKMIQSKEEQKLRNQEDQGNFNIGMDTDREKFV